MNKLAPILILHFALLLPQLMYGQKQSWNWYFGDHAGISFASGNPIPLLDGALSTGEGCASISDSLGSLLFYTDGITVYDSHHAIMANGTGLMGNGSSTQSGMIVKKPGSPNLYYIFTVDDNGFSKTSTQGFRYTIVDMSLNGGLGDIDPANKNILIRAGVMEKLTATTSRNGSDFWILITDFIEDKIFAYRFSCTGLDMIPVKSDVGPILLNDWRSTFGCMKVSRQNNRIAIARLNSKSFIVLDFDNRTGIASNRINITNSKIDNYTYGVEFSPNGKILYGTTADGPRGIILQNLFVDELRLFQFDLTSGNATIISNSLQIIGSHKSIQCPKYSFYYGGLQLGPDGKIYAAHCCDTTLGVVNTPDSLGSLCNYATDGVKLGGRYSKLGLPNIQLGYVSPAADTVQVLLCANDSYLLCNGTYVNTGGVYVCHSSTLTSCDSITVTNVTIIPVDTTITHFTVCKSSLPYLWQGQSVTQAGVYYSVLKSTSGCDSVLKLDISTSPVKDTGYTSLTLCTARLPYVWNSHSYTSPGIYNTLLTNSYGCDSVAQLILTVNDSSSSELDTTICAGNLPFRWNEQNYQRAGRYKLTLTNLNGCDSIANLYLLVDPVTFITTKGSICENENYVLPWGTVATSPGDYYDTLRHISGCDSIVRKVILLPKQKPNPALPVIQNLCMGDSISLFPGLFDSYLWQDGSGNAHYEVKRSGMYSVTVSNTCGSATVKTVVSEKDCAEVFPTAFTPGDDGRNDIFKILHAFSITDYRLQIYTRWGQKIFETGNPEKGWNGTFKNFPQAAGVYIYSYQYKKNGTIIKGKQTILLIR